MDETEVAKRVANQPQGSMTVVAHHSFTIHDILEGLGISDSRSTIDVSGSNYDNFLMLLRPTAGDPQLVHMTY